MVPSKHRVWPQNLQLRTRDTRTCSHTTSVTITRSKYRYLCFNNAVNSGSWCPQAPTQARRRAAWLSGGRDTVCRSLAEYAYTRTVEYFLMCSI
eukprot:9503854-Pyramimonas_sp.AAC.2